MNPLELIVTEEKLVWQFKKDVESPGLVWGFFILQLAKG
jgi:hypothetical protein